MGKIISIYGGNGSGKTTIAANLAYLISEDNSVGIISTEINKMSISTLMNMRIEDDKSIKKIYLNVNDKDYASKFAQCPNNKNMYILTFSDEMDCLTLADSACQLSGKEAQEIILNLKSKFDYLIFDCDNNVNNPLSTYSLVYSDTILNVIKPSTQGVNFEKAYKTFFSKLRINHKLIRVINNDKNYISLKTIENIIGPVDYILPYEKGIEIAENDGELYMSLGGGVVNFRSGFKEPWRKKFREIAERVKEIERI